MGLMNGGREITTLKILKLNMCHEVEDGNLQSTQHHVQQPPNHKSIGKDDNYRMVKKELSTIQTTKCKMFLKE
jgi:hypothetical protein